MKLEMSLALLLAAAYSVRHPVRAWPKVKRAFGLWFKLLAPGEWTVSQERYKRRMMVCRGCPVYVPRFKTCGSPARKGSADVGCFCYLPMKNALAASRCWGDLELPGEFEFGWEAAGID